MAEERCGFVAIVGRPNVGKSTLLNRLVRQKISITSRKPQTTRSRVLGIATLECAQIIYVDTPGWGGRQGRSAIKGQVRSALSEADVVLLVFDARGWQADDDPVLEQTKSLACPVVAVANKIDLVGDKRQVLPTLAMVSGLAAFAAIIPASAERNLQIEAVEATLVDLLPRRPHAFPADQVTDMPLRAWVEEIVREKIFRHLGDELPYTISVTVDTIEESASIVRIEATIWVLRASQRAIVIGANGALLRDIGTAARRDLEAAFGRKVFLQTWVKVGAPPPRLAAEHPPGHDR